MQLKGSAAGPEMQICLLYSGTKAENYPHSRIVALNVAPVSTEAPDEKSVALGAVETYYVDGGPTFG